MGSLFWVPFPSCCDEAVRFLSGLWWSDIRSKASPNPSFRTPYLSHIERPNVNSYFGNTEHTLALVFYPANLHAMNTALESLECPASKPENASAVGAVELPDAPHLPLGYRLILPLALLAARHLLWGHTLDHQLDQPTVWSVQRVIGLAKQVKGYTCLLAKGVFVISVRASRFSLWRWLGYVIKHSGSIRGSVCHTSFLCATRRHQSLSHCSQANWCRTAGIRSRCALSNMRMFSCVRGRTRRRSPSSWKNTHTHTH